MPSFCRLSLLLVLGAEVECDHRGYHDHHIVGRDTALECQNGEDGDDHQGDDGLNLDQRSEILQDIHICSSFNG